MWPARPARTSAGSSSDSSIDAGGRRAGSDNAAQVFSCPQAKAAQFGLWAPHPFGSARRRPCGVKSSPRHHRHGLAHIHAGLSQPVLITARKRFLMIPAHGCARRSRPKHETFPGTGLLCLAAATFLRAELAGRTCKLGDGRRPAQPACWAREWHIQPAGRR